ncbi:RNA chaperone Hfq [Bacillus pseudomycoides]|uniref:RNA chaperone Hfq n=1 Tax=Bacillus pseudomycoides TaxID=64104 RepID=UPI000BFCD662|nr:RNA chaperone Hfq [Bacillus pseudomycoides]PHE52753.1 RNA chaperone Hfq [Bacillus pseudomycoides]
MNGLQEKTFELLKEKKKPITVVLKSGVRITGQILAMDKFAILMMVHGKQKLVYKQAVSTITA